MVTNKDKSTNVVIIGTGAQAKYILDILSYYKVITVQAMVKINKTIDEVFKKDLKNIEIIEGLDGLESSLDKRNIKAIVGVADNQQKESIIKRLERLNIDLINIVHPRAIVSKKAKIDKNILINADAVIQPYSVIGKGVMLHTQVVVEHDCVIGDYVNLAPGVALAGGVKIGKYSYIYTGATVIPGVKIGVNSVVGAGAVVIKDVPDKVTVVGNPARIIKRC